MDTNTEISADYSVISRQFGFSGRAGEYFKIWIVNILLTIVTLGVYSAWAKVRRKRYFYGCTTLDGSSFEYLADPKRILIGRVIVYGLYAVSAALSNVSPFLGGFLFLGMFLLLPAFINRSLKFNAVNSCYRNVRFNFDSTYGKTFFVFIVLGFLTALTLGLLFPYYLYRIKKHVIENSRYGLQHFQFNGTPGGFYSFYAMGAVVGAAVLAGGSLLVGLLPFFVIFIMMAGGVLVYAYIYVSQTNYVLDCLRLKDHRFSSRMTVVSYMLISVTNYFAIVFTLGLLAPWASIRAAAYRINNISVEAAGDLGSFAAEQAEQVSALGEEFSDMFDVEIGL